MQGTKSPKRGHLFLLARAVTNTTLDMFRMIGSLGEYYAPETLQMSEYVSKTKDIMTDMASRCPIHGLGNRSKARRHIRMPPQPLNVVAAD